ncbi:ninjurin-A isoform X2 [Drosophila biarmipes]|uniref:ninjurin-A isoform X2 n=1 Tax=Drosophila biarmipes TaxID=125945 RepID=UPI001CDA7A25|nr:ninjurin-A isoform X2 [Drosophila biarmipes]
MSDLEHITLDMDKLPLGSDTTLTRNKENENNHRNGDAMDARNNIRVPRADDSDNDDRPFVKDGNDNPGVDDGLLEDGEKRRGGSGGGGGVNVLVPNGGRRPSFSFPGYNGPGFVTINGVETPIPDVNAYQHKKTLAQGMMDLALLSANANQLRYVLETSSQHPYFYPSLLFISLSIIFQIAVGVGLILNGQYNIKNEHDICRANRINNYTVIGIFIVTVVNVLISAFTVADPDTTTTVAIPGTGT